MVSSFYAERLTDGERITSEKLRRADYYRAQINVDQLNWAIAYGALKRHLRAHELSAIRNKWKDIVMADVNNEFKKAFKNPIYRKWLDEFVKDSCAEPEVYDDARALVKRLLDE